MWIYYSLEWYRYEKIGLESFGVTLGYLSFTAFVGPNARAILQVWRRPTDSEIGYDLYIMYCTKKESHRSSSCLKKPK